ncbi:MAG: 1-deoxy-D-xylulose-5-phosphate reductoisomerase, partial [Planctomycetota bacterium]|nr:1-deoxy-D-xylulose-5-phosphate reductoisomerase [Planctomycetota bacterium]
IAYALAYPEEPRLHFPLRFEGKGNYRLLPVDTERFPALGALMRLRLNAKPSYPIALNAADEVAVAAFLSGKIPFSSIPTIALETASILDGKTPQKMEDVYRIDSEARAISEERVKKWMCSFT